MYISKPFTQSRLNTTELRCQYISLGYFRCLCTLPITIHRFFFVCTNIMPYTTVSEIAVHDCFSVLSSLIPLSLHMMPATSRKLFVPQATKNRQRHHKPDGAPHLQEKEGHSSPTSRLNMVARPCHRTLHHCSSVSICTQHTKGGSRWAFMYDYTVKRGSCSCSCSGTCAAVRHTCLASIHPSRITQIKRQTVRAARCDSGALRYSFAHVIGTLC